MKYKTKTISELLKSKHVAFPRSYLEGQAELQRMEEALNPPVKHEFGITGGNTLTEDPFSGRLVKQVLWMSKES